jgi:serine/threonine protein phosphatase PrpC
VRPLPIERAPHFVFDSVSRSDVGCVRLENEDRLLDRPEAAIWAVADGMGGEANGAHAATHVIEALRRIEPGAAGYTTLADIESNLAAANHRLAAVPGGSTVAALLIHEGHYACLWAGDSRVYLFRDGRLEQITRDHSIVQQLLDAGALERHECQTHPDSHVVTRAIGAHASTVLDRCFAPVRNDDRFLLCSDGLTVCVTDSEIEEILAEADLSKAADSLLQKSLHAGTPDNVSFVILECKEISVTYASERCS